MTSFQKLQNRERAKQYILDQLGQGTTLARMVVEGQQFERGNFFVALPETIDPSDLREFRWELSDIEQTTTYDLFENLVSRFASESNGRVLLQDSNSTLSDRWLLGFEFRNHAIAYGDEVYWYLTGPAAKEGEIGSVISAASWWPFCAFFHTYQGLRETSSILSHQDLEQITKNLVGVAVDAFHATSFVLWWREDLVLLPKATSSPTQ